MRAGAALLTLCALSAGGSMVPSLALPPEGGGVYAEYRRGYDLILQEEWNGARRILDAMAARHPESPYAAEASYWSAFALAQSDRARAREAYRKFIRTHPHSRYFDDAVADYAALSRTMPRPGTGEASLDRTPDPSTRRRLETLSGLERSGPRRRVVRILREAATNAQENAQTRVAAMEALKRLEGQKALRVFVDVARGDASDEVRARALRLIVASGRGKGEHAVLAELLHPPAEGGERTRDHLFFSIADLGSDEAVELLEQAALHPVDAGDRLRAVSCLGSIGGERARSALLQILRGGVRMPDTTTHTRRIR
ncbi:MAG: outer membrane protein assembly factor BamD [Bacteroidota bacterium]